MKLTIIIPVYQVEATIDRCIESIVAQLDDGMEVILVDDGSTDHSGDRCDAWAASDSRLSVIHQMNGGLSAARNAGLRQARGEYVTFVDSDDYVGADTYRQVLPLLLTADIVEFPVWLFYGTPRQRLLTFGEQRYDSADDYWRLTRAYTHTYAWNKVYRRNLFDGVRFPEGRVFEDVYTLPRLLRRQPRVATTGRGAYYYCFNPGGITATARGEQLRMLLDAHLKTGMAVDDDYYMHMVNIQIDVCELTGDEPLLPTRKVKPQGSIAQKLKAEALNILGIKGLCKAIKILHHIRKPSRW